MPDVVLDALAPYVDVLSVQTFPSPGARSAERALDVIGRWHERTGLPVLVADTGNWCPTVMNPGRTGSARDQRERGAARASYGSGCGRSSCSGRPPGRWCRVGSAS
ncbi:hypothetical protein GTY87_00695 [Streptomyces sp. SID7813]|uniref:Uncharacterized protein n=1 Tax=Streptomyces coelicolor (strain ATCC BAA-471 / A3(2) / M145) TaxID=100226 RepID=Q9RJ09_STRCO|nr:hypothetical protein [Streptomyces sp. SID7813]QFI40460.1 hypothetical protein FQ762_00715 [Streptomyces coelicolor A3(2)]CAB53123.1 hypothetical protein SCJ1.05c [Streptomyces coelicolor A3(2)]